MIRTWQNIFVVVALAAGGAAVSGAATAQIKGPDRATFVSASTKSCTRTVTANHPNFPAATVAAYCSCMAEGEADVTTPDDIAYINAHHEAPPDYKTRISKLAANCNAKAGLHN
ncbi:MAG TPA: hypothetical protein VND87_05590 [Stellaceae bacterium]|nr:hypothetical protein [Stellaceae bacterium]